MFRICLIIFLSAALFPFSCFATVHDELQGIRKELKEKRRLLNKSVKVESKVSGELEQIEKQLQEKQKQLQKLKADLDASKKSVEDCRKSMESVRRDVEEKKEIIRKRIRSVYKAGDIGNARMVFSAESFPQMAENVRYTQSVLENDRKLVRQYLERLDELSSLEQRLKQNTVKLDSIKNSVALKSKEIESDRVAKSNVLAKVREEKKGYQASIKELQANARRLQSMIEKLEAESRKRYSAKSRDTGKGDKSRSLPPVPDKGFASQRGRLKLPVKGTVTARYGRHKHPEFNSYTVNNGLTISAPSGTPVKSVYDGKVIFADYFKGYGNMIIVDHGGGYFSLYAHNSSLNRKTGADVHRDEVIALSGDTDSTTGAALYFEIRHLGKPVDPSAFVH